jgi:hypothetical protein
MLLVRGHPEEFPPDLMREFKAKLREEVVTRGRKDILKDL